MMKGIQLYQILRIHFSLNLIAENRKSSVLVQ
jgi:hypothetical protein